MHDIFEVLSPSFTNMTPGGTTPKVVTPRGATLAGFTPRVEIPTTKTSSVSNPQPSPHIGHHSRHNLGGGDC